MKTNKKVAVVLGGGGGLGVAHIGFLEVLEKHNIPIDIITGTSMGALVGGIYATGVNLETMKEKMFEFKRNKMLDINLFKGGLIAGNRITKFLKKVIGEEYNHNIEDLPIKFAAIACDLVTGDKVVIDKGDIIDAIRASISIPGVFRPFRKDNMVLVDGGIVDNMPVTDARKMGADLVIAVDVHCFYNKRGNLNRVIPVAYNAINRLIVSFADAKKDKGDIHVKIVQPHKVSMENFSRELTKTSIECGRKAAMKVLPDILKALEE